MSDLNSLLDVIKKADIIRKGQYGKDVRAAIADAIEIAATGTTSTDDAQNNELNSLKTSLSTLAQADAILRNPMNHANIYRGKNLGSAVTDAQYKAISSGTFDDMYVGDYWSIGGVVYRIADFDYWLGTGYTDDKSVSSDGNLTKHHLVVVNDAIFKDGWHGPMNDTNITDGAYVGSKMYTETIPALDTVLDTAFGAGHVLTHYTYLTNATKDGLPSAGAWFGVKSEIMNEEMVYGCKINQPSGLTSNNYTVDNSQLALFRLRHQMIQPNRTGYWLRNVVSATSFALVDLSGYAAYYYASIDYRVRLAFPLGA